jgi:hypothetical protein
MFCIVVVVREKNLDSTKLNDRETGVGFAAGMCFSKLSTPTIGSNQRPKKWVPVAFSRWVTRPVRYADHSRSSAEVMNAPSYISTPTLACMAWCEANCRDICTVTVGLSAEQ